MPDHCVPEAVVKQLQLNRRGTGVGSAVGIATGVRSGVATTPGTLTNGDGAPGRVGTEGCVSGGGAGGGAGTCASAMPMKVAIPIPIAIATATAFFGQAPRRMPRSMVARPIEVDAEKILIASKIPSADPVTFSGVDARTAKRRSAPL